MGKFTRRAGRMLATGVLVLAGAGALMLAGAGTASARPAFNASCQSVLKAFQSIDTTLETKHSTVKADVAFIASKLTKAASTGSAALKSDVQTLITDLQAGADAGSFDSAKLNADDEAIVAVCAASNTPVGAPGTGGGSTAGLQDPALFGLGGAAVLAGVIVLCLALRNRRRTRVGHG